MHTRILTGITTTGTPHLGNYLGAIRPAVLASAQLEVDAFFFMADYHALIKCDDPNRIARSRLEVAATWLAAGLNPEKVTFYRQSDIPEIPQLCWLLTCITNKGLMNRAHAYKAAVEQNETQNLGVDEGINMGLFSYPILMAADILIFNAHKVPVGQDQIQHLEMARDIAQRFNYQFGGGHDFFVLPEAMIQPDLAILPGLDGRKMSKSYGNTIPLFEGGSAGLHAAIMSIKTDSRLPGEAKTVQGHALYAFYRAFASTSQTAHFYRQLQEGLSWGAAKQMLYELIESELAPMREQYEDLMAQPNKIENILQAGAEKARAQAKPFLEKIRLAVGLNPCVSMNKSASLLKKNRPKTTRFVSFRDEVGMFRFRFLAPGDKELFISQPFSHAKEMGAAIENFRTHPFSVKVQAEALSYKVILEDMVLGYGLSYDSILARDKSIHELQEILSSFS